MTEGQHIINAASATVAVARTHAAEVDLGEGWAAALAQAETGAAVP